MRKRNVSLATEYYHSFLGPLGRLVGDLLPEAALREYHSLLARRRRREQRRWKQEEDERV